MEEGAKNDFEKTLRESMEDFRVQPSEKVWEGVYRELHGSRRTALLWWAAAALLLVAVGIYSISRDERNHPKALSIRQGQSPETTTVVSGRAAGEKMPGDKGGVSMQDAVATPPRSVVSPAAAGSSSPGAGLPAVKPLASMTILEGALRPASQSPLQESSLSLPPLPGAGLASFFLKDPYIPATAFPLQAWVPADTLNGSSLSSNSYTGSQKKASISSRHRLSWGFYLTPAVGYRVFNLPTAHHGAPQMSVPPSSYPSTSFNYLAARARTKITYDHHAEWNWSAGAQLYYAFPGKWSVQSGLSLSQTGYKMAVYEASAAYVNPNGTASLADRSNTVNSGTTSYDLSAAASKPSYFHNRYLSLEIPLMIHRSFGAPENVSFDLGAGAGISYLAASKSLIFSPATGRYFSDKHSLRDVNATLHLETGILIPVGAKVRLSAGPSVQYQMTSTYKHYNLVKEHPYFVGLQLGMKWVK